MYCEYLFQGPNNSHLHYVKIHKVVYDAFELYNQNKNYAGLSVWEFVKKTVGAGDGRPD